MGKFSSTKAIGSSKLKGLERRATVRYRCSPAHPARAFFATSSRSIEAVVVDLSVGGIGLILGTYVEPGTLVRIELDSGAKVSYVDLAAHVTYATPLDDGSWRCGCAWVRELTEVELQVLR